MVLRAAISIVRDIGNTGSIGVTSVHHFSKTDRMIGARIGHLRVTGVLGSGGMGDVYRATDERLNRTVALKVIRADRRPSIDSRSRFLREARTLSALDHPNICRIHEYIEAEEGDFLVLELVDGVTLEKAIELGMSRARKLRIAIEICDALAAAHRKGIVHRDLKEENVMITPNGTAKVLDFGISRREEEHETPPPSSTPEEPIEQAATLIFPVGGASVTPPEMLPRAVTEQGIAVGTPATMSPEQAIGNVATSASDMYSFGLLLQRLFTEKPAHPEFLGARELMLRAAAGMTEPIVGQPRDITSLIERLEQKAPADRPTANEALRILKRIDAAPKRRVQLAMLITLVVLLAAFAAKYVYDVTSARRDAERKRAQAEELVSFIVGDLRTKLESVGRLDVLDGAASRALAYFASLDPEELSGDNLHKNALALAQLGEVRVNEGQLDEAVKMFRESIRFATAAVSRNDKRDEWKLALSNAHFWLGDALRKKGDHAGALRHFRSYLDIARQLADTHPGDAKYEAEVSYGYGNVGAAYEAAGDVTRALAEYRTAIELDRRRLQRDPSSEQWREDLATSLNRAGVAQQTTGDLTAARAAFAEEIALRRQLSDAAPGDARRIRELAVCLAYSGVLQQMMGENERAIASFSEELALSSELANRDPSNVVARRNRASAQSRLAVLLTNDLPRALTMIEEAEQVFRDVVKIDGRPAWRRDLASAIQRKGVLRLLIADRSQLREMAAEALAIVEKLAAQEPNNAHTTRVLCEVLLFAADAAPPDSEDAIRHRTRVAAIAAMADQRDPRITVLRVQALTGLGRRSETAPIARQ
ncbi:MAG TPA: protein kinase [Thermoanaerobaculia bacterium]|nr:protein kinase [Thermoanaerobaculia bacterium]